MMRALANYEGRFERKPEGVGKPGVVVLEARAFLAFAAARPQAAHEMGRTF